MSVVQGLYHLKKNVSEMNRKLEALNKQFDELDDKARSIITEIEKLERQYNNPDEYGGEDDSDGGDLWDFEVNTGEGDKDFEY